MVVSESPRDLCYDRYWALGGQSALARIRIDSEWSSPDPYLDRYCALSVQSAPGGRGLDRRNAVKSYD